MGQILVRINFHCLKISFEFLGQRNKRKLAPNENFLLYGIIIIIIIIITHTANTLVYSFSNYTSYYHSPCLMLKATGKIKY